MTITSPLTEDEIKPGNSNSHFLVTVKLGSMNIFTCFVHHDTFSQINTTLKNFET